MERFDDSDMKVVSEDVNAQAAPRDDAAEEAAILAREKQNGNVAKARRLGALLAESVLADDGFSSVEGVDDAVLKTQRFALANFAVEVGLDAFLPNAILAQTAGIIFDDTLKITAPEQTDSLNENSAVSFYYLNIRAGRGKVEMAIGATFASFCGAADNAACRQAGRDLYLSTLSQVKSLVSALRFV